MTPEERAEKVIVGMTAPDDIDASIIAAAIREAVIEALEQAASMDEEGCIIHGKSPARAMVEAMRVKDCPAETRS